MRRFMRFVIGGLALATTLHANPVSELDYQGRVLVNDLPFTGNGYFKFAIANAGGSTNYWSNDGTGTGQPAGHLTNSVFNGVFSTILGASPMTAINPSIFNNGSDLYLRVWFSTTTNAFSEMLPAQKIVSAAYAINAGLVGGQAPSQLVATAVAQATNGITMAGDVTGTPQANNIAAGVIVDTDVNANAAIAATKIANTALVQSTTFAGDVGGSFGNLQIGAGAVANTEVAANAAIAATKIANTALVQNTVFAGDVGGSFGNLQVAPGAIVNADVSASAGIEGSKVQAASTTNAGVIRVSSGFGATAPFEAVDNDDTRLNSFGVVNSFTASAPGSSLVITGGTGVTVANLPGNIVQINSSGGSSAPFVNVIFVATNGASGNIGSIGSPLPNPQEGYDLAAAGPKPAAVIIAAGRYGTNGLVMNVSDVHVMGMGRPEINDLTVSAAPTLLGGKTRVEGLLVRGFLSVQPTGDRVKFHNCRFRGGAVSDADRVEFKDCQFQVGGGQGSALVLGSGAAACEIIGIYQTSIQNNDNASPALRIGENVGSFEMIGCEIVNEDNSNGAAIQDDAVSVTTLRLITHNYIKGPQPGGGSPAVTHPAILTTPTMFFAHNIVHGDVGVADAVQPPNLQYYANNTVFGTINYVPSGLVGWINAGTWAADMANNSEASGPAPSLPANWED